MKMELSPEVLDIIDIAHDKDVIEVLKQVIKDDDVIFKSDAPESMEEPNAEEDIEEIIEIIEEVEETDESNQTYNSNTLLQEKQSKSINDENFDQNVQNVQFDKNSTTEIYTFDEESSMFKTQPSKERTNKQSTYSHKTKNKQVIAYDVDEDWQDEEMEHIEEIEEKLDQSPDAMEHQEILERPVLISGDKKSMSSQILRTDSKGNAESSTKAERSKSSHDIGNNINVIKTIDNNVSHEIVKNVENNLLYTVLGSKKQGSSLKQDAHYIKMERLEESTIPVEGTIYYDRDNMETLYVAQTVDENEQYQYDTSQIETEQNEQVWEGTNQDSNENQEGEENSQDQIFLHEDEDGQLYFKDDNGALQPVYLTEDGNYAIAENSDDQDSKESQSKSQQSSRQSEDSNFGVQDVEHRSSSNKQTTVAPTTSLHDLDNEDNTVTISLIISEDEHGQKRTQVIIPTTDNMKCDICNKSFKTSFQLLRHTRLKHAREEDITTRNFPCDLCPKRYPDQNSLARHRKTHTGDRPFQCLECHKNFPTSTALRRHLTLHNSQSRPLPCIYCGRRFVDKASLIKHEQSHLAGDQRNHTCDICHKSFLHATDLSMHKKYHDPDKKFDCEQGANEEILSCDVCGITYKFMSSLTRHMVTTHMNPEKLRQQAEEQRRKRENNYRRYLENRKMYETQQAGGYAAKRNYHHNARILTGSTDDTA